jgi:cell division protein FtsN
MARDQRRREHHQPSGRPLGSWVTFVSGLLLGLTAAVIVYFAMTGRAKQPQPQATPEVASSNNAREAIQNADAEVLPAPVEPEAAPVQAVAPKPDFDFYQVLPGTEVKVPDSELASPTPPSRPAETNVTFLLQVGSYQKFEEADQAKAQLALQGISSTIQRVVINGHDIWYRVHVGPLKTMPEVQSMRARLLESGQRVVVLKVAARAQ